MPTMQKAFIVQGLTKLGDAESAEFVVGNLEPNEVGSILHILRTERELQEVTEASHGELSVENARLKERVQWLSHENDVLENKLAGVPHETKLLAMLCCSRVLLKYSDTPDKLLNVRQIEIKPMSIEMRDGQPRIFGRLAGGGIQGFSSAQIISFTVLRDDVEQGNVTLPDPEME